MAIDVKRDHNFNKGNANEEVNPNASQNAWSEVFWETQAEGKTEATEQ